MSFRSLWNLRPRSWKLFIRVLSFRRKRGIVHLPRPMNGILGSMMHVDIILWSVITAVCCISQSTADFKILLDVYMRSMRDCIPVPFCRKEKYFFVGGMLLASHHRVGGMCERCLEHSQAQWGLYGLAGGQWHPLQG